MKLVGNLLIAPPSVKGNFWYKTVIMVTEHHDQGSIGIVLNKRSDLTVAELGHQLNLDLDNVPGYVYIGGPVSQKSLSIIHSNEWSCNNTLKLNKYFSISSSSDMLSKFQDGILPREWRMFVGMCGWAHKQLDNEINGVHPYKHETSWCISSSSLNLVFESDNKEQWAAALEQSGIEFAQNILI